MASEHSKRRLLKEIFSDELSDSSKGPKTSPYWTDEQIKPILQTYAMMRKNLQKLDSMLASEEGWIKEERSAPYFRDRKGMNAILEVLSTYPQLLAKLGKHMIALNQGEQYSEEEPKKKTGFFSKFRK